MAGTPAVINFSEQRANKFCSQLRPSLEVLGDKMRLYKTLILFKHLFVWCIFILPFFQGVLGSHTLFFALPLYFQTYARLDADTKITQQGSQQRGNLNLLGLPFPSMTIKPLWLWPEPLVIFSPLSRRC